MLSNKRRSKTFLTWFTILFFQEECNYMACKYDGGDCSLGVTDLWKDCLAPINGVYCSDVFRDGVCNSGCNNEKCLFDGNDCRNQLTCNPHFKDYCELNYDNGHCDQGCNNAACNWDGNDCTNYVPMNNLKGTMIIFVISTEEQFLKDSKDFLRNMGLLLGVIVKIKKDSGGNYLIKPWSANSENRSKRSIHQIWSSLVRRLKRETEQADGLV